MGREILQRQRVVRQRKKRRIHNAEGEVERVKNFNPAENGITYGKRDRKLRMMTGLNR